ncbi:TonB-dependent receptor [Sandaracinobacter sp. RS1-74]|uniref:TonB-dependent receptor n=1 Tax=Sandaracinobacteroides sayramensis TaxID=2913411 RepID=UPI001EDBA7E9|nr:TonB-dependent receptor [Sandaracinobacteroides sayramensis]MCG2842547.1 TonB-dependent receptor [Sandaracinobacteroides sayramensis]
MALRLTSMLLAGLRLGASASVLALAATSVHAQEVTGTIRGEVQDDAGNPLAGATVTITHAPSGTRSVQTTNATGTFSAPNLRVGGPYDLTVSADGFDEAKATISSLAAGQPQRIAVTLVPAGQTIEVTASRRSNVTLASGPATILSANDIAGVASINRDVRQLAARDPMVSLDPTNGTGAISIAGQNNRFNRITVDGIAFGDPFGLEAGGLASSRGPVPLDAIGEFSVEVAPADIQQGNFQGGAVNSVLKSGGNEYNFTGFYSYTSDKLGGTRTRDIRVDRDYKSTVWGVQATGPIIKDKLFFAVTYEQMQNKTPSDVGPAGENFANTLAAVTRADVTKVQEIANRVYNYDAMDVAESVDENDKKLAVKLDWNITDNHRAAFTYIYSKGDLLAGQTSANQVGASNPTLSLQSNNYSQGSINHYWVGQLNSDWSSNFSTQVRVSYNDYKRLQSPYNGRDFGQFQVCLTDTPTVGTTSPNCAGGVGRIQFGPDVSRQANELTVKTLGTELQARYRQDRHDVKLIVERRQQDYNNLFAQNVSGNWRFDSLADLEAQRANSLFIATPVSGDINDVAAIFKATTWTFGAQDVWDATSDLSLQFGLRYDLYEMGDRPAFNQAFTDRYGFTNTSTLNGRGVFQPRFGANWRPTDRLTARLSAGLFAGGSPNVWLSNSFSNPGPLLASSTIQRTANGTFSISDIRGLTPEEVQALGAATLNGVTGGTGIPNALLEKLRTAGPALAATNAIDPSLRLPSQWRVAGSVNYEANLGALGDDWNFGADVVWSRVKDAWTWTDLRSTPNGKFLPDGRPQYMAGVTGSNNQDLLIYNTDKGYSWNIVGHFNKRFDFGLDVNGAYTWQRVRDVSSATSSTAGSNFGNAAAIDPNHSAYGISNYQRDNAWRLGVGYQKELFGDNVSRIDLFFNSTSGQRYSYTFQDSTSGRSAVFGTTGTNNRYLVYVPDVSSATADPLVQYATTADYEKMRDLVLNGDLKGYQGKIAPKNIGRSPRWNKLDLHISQEIPFVFSGKVEVFADFENVLNMLNKDWGSLRQVSFPYYATVANVALNADGSKYIYSNVRNPSLTNSSTISIWQVRLGARLSFRGL